MVVLSGATQLTIIAFVLLSSRPAFSLEPSGFCVHFWTLVLPSGIADVSDEIGPSLGELVCRLKYNTIQHRKMHIYGEQLLIKNCQ